ncbi:MAG TPA: glycoside hydrolase family 31 protein [Herpetosiphonaceae bacterium]
MQSSATEWQVAGRDEHQLILRAGSAQMSLSVCTDQAVRVRMSSGSHAAHRSWSVVPSPDAWPPVAWQLRETESLLTIETDALRVQVDRRDGKLAFFAADGRVFCQDRTPAELAPGAVAAHKLIHPEERFYGFGERTGLLEKTGQRYTHWTYDPENPHTARVDEMYATFPVYLSVRPGLAYGIIFNTTFRSQFDIGRAESGTFAWRTSGPELDYVVLGGPTPADVAAQLAQLTGSTPLPPRWALGYHQSRWSYEDEPTVRELAAQFRGRRIPCDAIHFDIDYMRGYRVFTWDPERFPDPAGLIGDLRAQGFNVVTIIDPGVKTDPDYPVFSEGLEQDLFVRRADGSLFSGYVWPDDSAFADFTRPAARAWWGGLHRALLDAGVRGIWDDMNEPTVFAKPFSEGGGAAGTIDLDAPQGDPAERTTHAEVHNLYGLLMARATHEGLLALRPDERPFVLTRSGFTGLQRWATLWTGDNSALWEHLEMTLPQIINIGLSGVPFVGVDIGGFFDDASPELWARWVQLGAFLPFCRGHSCSGTRQCEPWMHGEGTEAIARAYLTLRYRLLPYLYTVFHEAATTGAPIIRPLFFAFPDDAATYHRHDQALVGPQLMVAPITRPGLEHRAVYLPEGEWYDWWTGERLRGPLHLLAHAPLERLPLYVRGGSILPLGPAMQHTAERPLDALTLDIYPAGASSWTLYEDDGISFEYQDGAWATTTYRCVEGDGRLEIAIEARAGGWTPAPRALLLNIHAGPPRQVTLDGAETDAWAWSDATIIMELTDDGAAHQLVITME